MHALAPYDDAVMYKLVADGRTAAAAWADRHPHPTTLLRRSS
jgi:hypothetical protein